MAIAEVAAIEQAWRAYLNDYRGSPRNSMPTFDTPSDVEGLSGGILIEGDMARTLMGINVNDNNPRKIRYMEFKHLDESGEPVNPWWRKGVPASQRAKYRYHAKLDYNLDERIDAGTGEPNDPPRSMISSPVIVWTYNPNETYAAGDPKDHVIGSWER